MDAIGGVGMAGAAMAQLEVTSAPARFAEVDAARFAEMVQPAALPALPALPGIAAPDAVLPGATPGDSILEGMKGLGSDFRESWSALRTALEGPMDKMTITDMLRLQLQMVQISVQVELVGKAISKATSNIDQLSKLQ
jgi:type III secretion protein I